MLCYVMVMLVDFNRKRIKSMVMLVVFNRKRIKSMVMLVVSNRQRINKGCGEESQMSNEGPSRLPETRWSSRGGIAKNRCRLGREDLKVEVESHVRNSLKEET